MQSQIHSPMATMTLIFREGEAYLSNTETNTLKAWIMGCSTYRGPKLVTIGGAHETSRAGRLRRVNSLLQVFNQLGVRTQNIHPDEDLTRPSRMGSMDDLPADVVWLQLLPDQQNKHPA